MEVKGIALIPIYEYVKVKHPERLKEWINSLPESSKAIYSAKILPTQWYPVKEGITIPLIKFCDMFFKGSLRGSWETGRFSADYGLRGVYKIFLKLSNVHIFARRAEILWSSYYSNLRAKLTENNPGRIVFEIYEFPDIHEILEHSIGGFLERAGELYNLNNLSVNIDKSLAKGDDLLRYVIAWDK